jgi:hypothetical protein
MSRATIRSLINAHVASIPGLPPLQLENTPNIGQTGKPFSRLTLLPARSRSSSVGRNGTDLHRAIVQIDLFYPIDMSTRQADLMADIVCSHFPRGFVLGEGDVHVHFSTPSIDAGYIFEPFYCLPVVVEWSSVLPAQ